MSTFGADLRHARELAGVSLEQISAESKVSVRNLRALEEERFDLLPGGILARGFLRAYLSYLALDESEWLPRFTEAFRGSGMSGDGDDAWLAYAEAVTGVKPSPAGTDRLRFRWLGVVLLMLAAALLAIVVWRFAVHRLDHSGAGPHGPAALSEIAMLPGKSSTSTP